MQINTPWLLFLDKTLKNLKINKFLSNNRDYCYMIILIKKIIQQIMSFYKNKHMTLKNGIINKFRMH